MVRNLRVISGRARGLKLKSVKGMSTRPTADRIKESLFNILSPVLTGAKVLDLFAGTGALGIESLSRGAESAVFIDKSPESVSVIRDNLQHTGLQALSKVFQSDFENGLKKLSDDKEKFDIIFLDPPYGKGLDIKAVDLIDKYCLLEPDGLIIIESEKIYQLPDRINFFKKVDLREYGRTTLNFYKAETGAVDSGQA